MVHSDHIGKARTVSPQAFDISSASEHHFSRFLRRMRSKTASVFRDVFVYEKLVELMMDDVSIEMVSNISSYKFSRENVIRNGAHLRSYQINRKITKIKGEIPKSNLSQKFSQTLTQNLNSNPHSISDLKTN